MYIDTWVSTTAMTESRRRRRKPLALSVILSAMMAGSRGASAFVSHSSVLSLPAGGAPAVSAVDRIPQPQAQHQQHQRRDQRYCSQRSRRGLGIDDAYPGGRVSLAPLAGALTADSASVDHTDGWNPLEGVEIGTVSLVGSGPGDPDLLTVAGLRELQSADLVIADRLVSKEILGLVTGELKVARKYPGCAEQAQREIYRWMREGLSTGKHVVRLKIGDPFIFGRGGEEVLEMRELGVEPKVVPGISSVFSAPLLGGVPVTHRGVATQVTLGTGYGQDYSRPDICDYHPQKTAVFLMAIGRLEELCEDLVRRSYPRDTPVAIVENASTPRQRVIAGTVDTMAGVARGLKVKAPATIVVGEVVSVLHGPQEGLISDAANGMFHGVAKDMVKRAAKKVAEETGSVVTLNGDGAGDGAQEILSPTTSTTGGSIA